MNTAITSINNTKVTLFPSKGILIDTTLIISDVHLGKVSHFRKSGIPVPGRAFRKNLEVLIDLIKRVSPSRMIFLGDLFHSYYNAEWEEFGQVLRNFPHIQFDLVMGNHDIMSRYQYEKLNLKIHQENLIIGDILLSHEPMESGAIPENLYNLAGHIHPCVSLKGKGRQTMMLPCFYFEERKGLLPAFGTFTGMHRIKPAKESKVFLIVNNSIVQKVVVNYGL